MPELDGTANADSLVDRSAPAATAEGGAPKAKRESEQAAAADTAAEGVPAIGDSPAEIAGAVLTAEAREDHREDSGVPTQELCGSTAADGAVLAPDQQAVAPWSEEAELPDGGAPSPATTPSAVDEVEEPNKCLHDHAPLPPQETAKNARTKAKQRAALLSSKNAAASSSNSTATRTRKQRPSGIHANYDGKNQKVNKRTGVKRDVGRYLETWQREETTGGGGGGNSSGNGSAGPGAGEEEEEEDHVDRQHVAGEINCDVEDVAVGPAPEPQGEQEEKEKEGVDENHARSGVMKEHPSNSKEKAKGLLDLGQAPVAAEEKQRSAEIEKNAEVEADEDGQGCVLALPESTSFSSSSATASAAAPTLASSSASSTSYSASASSSSSTSGSGVQAGLTNSMNSETVAAVSSGGKQRETTVDHHTGTAVVGDEAANGGRGEFGLVVEVNGTTGKAAAQAQHPQPEVVEEARHSDSFKEEDDECNRDDVDEFSHLQLPARNASRSSAKTAATTSATGTSASTSGAAAGAAGRATASPSPSAAPRGAAPAQDGLDFTFAPLARNACPPDEEKRENPSVVGAAVVPPEVAALAPTRPPCSHAGERECAATSAPSATSTPVAAHLDVHEQPRTSNQSRASDRSSGAGPIVSSSGQKGKMCTPVTLETDWRAACGMNKSVSKVYKDPRRQGSEASSGSASSPIEEEDESESQEQRRTKVSEAQGGMQARRGLGRISVETETGTSSTTKEIAGDAAEVVRVEKPPLVSERVSAFSPLESLSTSAAHAPLQPKGLEPPRPASTFLDKITSALGGTVAAAAESMLEHTLGREDSHRVGSTSTSSSSSASGVASTAVAGRSSREKNPGSQLQPPAQSPEELSWSSSKTSKPEAQKQMQKLPRAVDWGLILAGGGSDRYREWRRECDRARKAVDSSIFDRRLTADEIERELDVPRSTAGRAAGLEKIRALLAAAERYETALKSLARTRQEATVVTTTAAGLATSFAPGDGTGSAGNNIMSMHESESGGQQPAHQGASKHRQLQLQLPLLESVKSRLECGTSTVKQLAGELRGEKFCVDLGQQPEDVELLSFSLLEVIEDIVATATTGSCSCTGTGASSDRLHSAPKIFPKELPPSQLLLGRTRLPEQASGPAGRISRPSAGAAGNSRLPRFGHPDSLSSCSSVEPASQRPLPRDEGGSTSPAKKIMHITSADEERERSQHDHLENSSLQLHGNQQQLIQARVRILELLQNNEVPSLVALLREKADALPSIFSVAAPSTSRRQGERSLLWLALETGRWAVARELLVQTCFADKWRYDEVAEVDKNKESLVHLVAKREPAPGNALEKECYTEITQLLLAKCTEEVWNPPASSSSTSAVAVACRLGSLTFLSRLLRFRDGDSVLTPLAVVLPLLAKAVCDKYVQKGMLNAEDPVVALIRASQPLHDPLPARLSSSTGSGGRNSTGSRAANSTNSQPAPACPLPPPHSRVLSSGRGAPPSQTQAPPENPSRDRFAHELGDVLLRRNRTSTTDAFRDRECFVYFRLAASPEEKFLLRREVVLGAERATFDSSTSSSSSVPTEDSSRGLVTIPSVVVQEVKVLQVLLAWMYDHTKLREFTNHWPALRWWQLLCACVTLKVTALQPLLLRHLVEVVGEHSAPEVIPMMLKSGSQIGISNDATSAWMKRVLSLKLCFFAQACLSVPKKALISAASSSSSGTRNNQQHQRLLRIVVDIFRGDLGC